MFLDEYHNYDEGHNLNLLDAYSEASNQHF